MSQEPSKRKTEHRLGKVADAESSSAWAEILAELDATEVRDGFMVERDMKPAEARPALNAFFGAKRARKS